MMPTFEETQKAHERANVMRYAHYQESKTYKAIAQEHGISKQRVYQIITKAGRKKVISSKTLQKIVFPSVVDYCTENRLSLSKFMERCGFTSEKDKANLRNFLYGKHKPKYKYAKAVSNVTGIDIETLLGDESD